MKVTTQTGSNLKPTPPFPASVKRRLSLLVRRREIATRSELDAERRRARHLVPTI